MESLKDPCNDRHISDLEAPPYLPLSDELLYPPETSDPKKLGKSSKAERIPDWKALKDHFSKEGRLSKEHCHQILKDMIAIFCKLPPN